MHPHTSSDMTVQVPMNWPREVRTSHVPGGHVCWSGGASREAPVITQVPIILLLGQLCSSLCVAAALLLCRCKPTHNSSSSKCLATTEQLPAACFRISGMRVCFQTCNKSIGSSCIMMRDHYCITSSASALACMTGMLGLTDTVGCLAAAGAAAGPFCGLSALDMSCSSLSGAAIEGSGALALRPSFSVTGWPAQFNTLIMSSTLWTQYLPKLNKLIRPA